MKRIMRSLAVIGTAAALIATAAPAHAGTSGRPGGDGTTGGGPWSCFVLWPGGPVKCVQLW